MPMIYVDKKSDLPDRVEDDVYNTPEPVVQHLVDIIRHERVVAKETFAPYHVLDIGAGAGVWGKFIKNTYHHCLLSGVESRILPPPEYYDEWYEDNDFIDFTAPQPYDLILGNPPYLHTKPLIELIKHALYMLEHRGWLALLLKENFLFGTQRKAEIFDKFPPYQVWNISNRVPFTGPANTWYSTFVIWKQGFEGTTELHWTKWEKDNS